MADVKEEVVAYVKQSLQDAMGIAKTYIDNGDAANGQALTDAVSNLQGHIDTLAGDTGALEKINGLLAKLKEDGDIENLLAGFSDLDARLDQLRTDVNASKTVADAAKIVGDNNKNYIDGTV